MNSSVKVIKRDKNEILTEVQASQDERTTQNAREMMRTVKGWIAELHRRRRDEELATSAFRKMRVTLPLIVLFILCVGTESNCQQGLAPFPHQGMVNGLGSRVLISNDGKVLTATHLVQAADRTLVEFSSGELIPAHVTGSAFSADGGTERQLR